MEEDRELKGGGGGGGAAGERRGKGQLGPHKRNANHEHCNQLNAHCNS